MASWAAHWDCTCCGANSPLAHLPRSADRSNAGGVRSPARFMAARRAPRSPSSASTPKAISTPGSRHKPGRQMEQPELGWVPFPSNMTCATRSCSHLASGALFSLLLFINRKRAARITNQLSLLPLLAGAGLQIIQYNITGYSALKEWYWVSQMVFITLAGALLLDILSQPLRRLPIVYVSIYLAVIYFGIISGLQFAAHHRRSNAVWRETYRYPLHGSCYFHRNTHRTRQPESA